MQSSLPPYWGFTPEAYVCHILKVITLGKAKVGV